MGVGAEAADEAARDARVHDVAERAGLHGGSKEEKEAAEFRKREGGGGGGGGGGRTCALVRLSVHATGCMTAPATSGMARAAAAAIVGAVSHAGSRVRTRYALAVSTVVRTCRGTLGEGGEGE